MISPNLIVFALLPLFLSGCIASIQTSPSINMDPNQTLLLLAQQKTLEKVLLNNKATVPVKKQSNREDEIRSLRSQLRAVTMSYRDLRANINKTDINKNDSRHHPKMKKIPYPEETMSGDTTVFLLEEP